MSYNTDIETDETNLSSRRTFDAPLDRIWVAWTDPEQAEKWWGPDGSPSRRTRSTYRRVVPGASPCTAPMALDT